MERKYNIHLRDANGIEFLGFGVTADDLSDWGIEVIEVGPRIERN